MSEQSVLTEDMKKAIHERAALLHCVVCEAEGQGVQPELIAQHFAEELYAMQAELSDHCSPERVEAVVNELANAFETYLGPRPSNKAGRFDSG
jgi:hypothetical protein